MRSCHIAYIDDSNAANWINRDIAACQFHNAAAGNLVQVAGTKDHRWVQDNGVLTSGNGTLDFLFGEVFAVAVGEFSWRQIKRHGFVGREAILAEANRCGTAGENHALDASTTGSVENVGGAVDVDQVQLDAVGAPVIGNGGDMKDPIAALHGAI